MGSGGGKITPPKPQGQSEVRPKATTVLTAPRLSILTGLSAENAAIQIILLRQVGYREAVSKHLPFRLTSLNAIDPVETFTAFLFSVVAGARRFAHTSLLRADVALHALLGITRFPVDDSIRNLFKRFMADSKVHCPDLTRASMDSPHIIRWWPCWPRRTFCCTAG
jgi:hypothetical protein